MVTAHVRKKDRFHWGTNIKKWAPKAFLTALLSLVLLLRRPISQAATGELLKMTASASASSAENQLACLRTVLSELPTSKRLGKNGVWFDTIHAHHWDATENIEFYDKRYDRLPQLVDPPCSVWEVGAHTKANDTKTFLGWYPKCQYHAYEPIPVYYDQLQRNWKNEPRVQTHK